MDSKFLLTYVEKVITYMGDKQENIETNMKIPSLDLSKVERVEIDNPETGKKRIFSGWRYWFVAAVAFAASCFHLYTAAFGLFDAMTQRSIHFAFMGALVFLCYPIKAQKNKDKIDPWDWLCAALIILCCGNILLNFEAIAMREGRAIPSDIYLGVVMVLLVLEASRRSLGWPLPIVAVFALAYAFFGPYFPGMLGHRGVGIRDLAPFMYLRTDGIFGVPLGVSASFIFLFCLFGAFLAASGAGQFFIDLAVSLTGKSTGGAGKAAVTACALMGTVSGSSTANAVTTGSFTIPLMRQSGYSPNFAAAVVAAASAGAQFLPPVMGAAAFIMAQFLGVAYWDIVVVAAIPASLYLISIFVMVHFHAKKAGMECLDASGLPKTLDTLKRGWNLLLPILVLIFILASGYSPIMSVFWSIVAIVVFSWLGAKENRMTPKKILDAMINGGLGAIEVASACACAGIIIGVIAITGVGLAFSSFILSLSYGILPLALILTMVGSIILGLGIPTTAKYIIVSTLAAPALAQMGVPLIAAHLFCLYFGILADVTPPVALATFAAANIAKAPPMKAAVTAFALAVAGFIVPFMFVYNPALLMRGSVFEIITVSVLALAGIIALAAAVQGYFLNHLNILQRLFLFAVPILITYPSATTKAAGIGIIAIIYFMQKRQFGLPAIT